jgi:anti-sigma28 factor (negative regulator of flagellin synthesis)
MKIHGLGVIQQAQLLRLQEKGEKLDRSRVDIGAETVELSDTARFIREIRDQLAERPESRTDMVEQAKVDIANGTLDTDHELEVAVDAFLASL